MSTGAGVVQPLANARAAPPLSHFFFALIAITQRRLLPIPSPPSPKALVVDFHR